MKEFFMHNVLLSEIPMSEDEHRCSSNSISPMVEDPMLSYPSTSHSPYIMVSRNQTDAHMPNSSLFDYFHSSPNYSSGSDNQGSLIYPNTNIDNHTFMPSSNGYNTSTPSPTSSISSGPLPTYTTTSVVSPGTEMYLQQVSKDCLQYHELGYSHHTSSSSTTPNSDGSIYPSSGFGAIATVSTDGKSLQNSSAAHVSNGSTATMVSQKNYNGKKYKYSSVNQGKKVHNTKGQTREKPKKRCSNCHCIQSPSWRRSISKLTKGDLLCNACGLYEKTAKKKRMLVTHDDGNTKVIRKREARDYCCSVCGVKDATRWRRVYDSIQCERCARHSRSINQV